MSNTNYQEKIAQIHLSKALAMLAKAELIKTLYAIDKTAVSKNEILGNIDVMNGIIQSK